jgi:hypothetical protein
LINAQSVPIGLKGYIVATSFATDANATSKRTTVYVEDPVTIGESISRDVSPPVGRVTLAMHYGRVFSKIGLRLIASALSNGFSLTGDAAYQVPVWTCLAPPFQGRTFIGGYYRTDGGPGPILTEKGWRASMDLGVGHSVFVGLESSIALDVARAARGEWERLDSLSAERFTARVIASSEFAWLPDGTVAAPADYFVPTALEFI